MFRKGGLFFIAILLTQSLTGCIGDALDTTVNPRAVLTAFPTLIQEGEMVTFDARQSDPIEGVISEYHWDFGDGEEIITIAGFTSHQYVNYGIYTARLTVSNDQGGSDSTSVMINVNGAPLLNLSIPTDVRSGDTVMIDASETSDPEGGELIFSWDLDHLDDSDGDGDARNDVDSMDKIVYISTNHSGSIVGSVFVEDMEGASTSQQFTIEVQSRMYKVVWVENILEWEFDGYLAEGETWDSNMTPGDGARIMAYEAILELDQETPLALPPDNFTLSVNVVDAGHYRSSQTSPGNITQNETTRAELNASDLNAPGVNDFYEADSEEQLIAGLLNEVGERFGQGEWIWTVVARDADPDSAIPGLPDPDEGNDWTLTITITVLTPVLTEIAYE